MKICSGAQHAPTPATSGVGVLAPQNCSPDRGTAEATGASAAMAERTRRQPGFLIWRGFSRPPLCPSSGYEKLPSPHPISEASVCGGFSWQNCLSSSHEKPHPLPNVMPSQCCGVITWHACGAVKPQCASAGVCHFAAGGWDLGGFTCCLMPHKRPSLPGA